MSARRPMRLRPARRPQACRPQACRPIPRFPIDHRLLRSRRHCCSHPARTIRPSWWRPARRRRRPLRCCSARRRLIRRTRRAMNRSSRHRPARQPKERRLRLGCRAFQRLRLPPGRSVRTPERRSGRRRAARPAVPPLRNLPPLLRILARLATPCRRCSRPCPIRSLLQMHRRRPGASGPPIRQARAVHRPALRHWRPSLRLMTRALPVGRHCPPAFAIPVRRTLATAIRPALAMAHWIADCPSRLLLLRPFRPPRSRRLGSIQPPRRMARVPCLNATAHWPDPLLARATARH